MDNIKVNIDRTADFVDRQLIEEYIDRANNANLLLENGKGAGSDYLGWVNLPDEITDDLLEEIQSCADRLRELAEVIITIGIGGSYLGAKAVTEAMSGSFDWLENKSPRVVFAGQNLSEDYLTELLFAVREKSVAVIVISKSGTTTEPAVAFRIFKKELEDRYGKKGAAERIVAITDRERGALKELAVNEGYKTFVIEDNIGGRYSVLTPVGLLPAAVAGIDIRSLIRGARAMREDVSSDNSGPGNPAVLYTAARNALYSKGYDIEILASYEPRLVFFSEWWKQLYGESEGKENKGIYPASVTYTADLHSMGQYVQEGKRNLMETVISIEEPNSLLKVEDDPGNIDGLNFLAGKRLGEINRMAELGVALAHVDGGVPNMRITIEKLDEFSLGALLYFFERACGISGYLLGVNPFDQPGVEAYKKNMFALLGKPGYEEEGEELRKRI